MINKAKVSLIALSMILFCVTLGLYWQTRNFDFINYDDNFYVYESECVTNGLTISGLKWAFTDSVKTTSNWHPLTLMSYMLDVTLFGVNSGAMHLHNALLHSVNSVLLFVFLLLLMGETPNPGHLPCNEKCRSRLNVENLPYSSYLAAFIGASFWALHPLRVESVAWISQRKDVLCLFWYLLGHLTYLKGIIARKNFGDDGKEFAFLMVMICFIMALMAKPTAIVFPCTLLLLEYIIERRIDLAKLLTPLIIAIIYACVTIAVQDVALSQLPVPLTTRIINAVASVGLYCRKTFWAEGFCIAYPYETPIPPTRILMGLCFIVCAYYFVFPFLKRVCNDFKKMVLLRRMNCKIEDFMFSSTTSVSFGLLWFFISLIPVLGFLQVGIASHADRYTYLPGIGLSIVITLGLVHAFGRVGQWMRTSIAVISLLALSVLSFVAHKYIATWENTLTTFGHALQVVPNNVVAYANISAYWHSKKDFNKFLYYSRLVVVQESSFKISLTRMEHALILSSDWKDSNISNLDEILNLEVKAGDPMLFEKKFALAFIALGRGLLSSAEMFIKECVQLKPADGFSWELYSRIMYQQQRYNEAWECLGRAYKLMPDYKPIRNAREKLCAELDSKNIKPVE